MVSYIMRYEVRIKKSVLKKLGELPEKIRIKLNYLILDLQEHGAIQKKWKNFSCIGENKYHCHLDYNYVVCWYWEKKSIIIEVYYAGSREKAPY
jgi:mRNA-degrading endonuclease RelE of RelBE toxin-antitoxin system